MLSSLPARSASERGDITTRQSRRTSRVRKALKTLSCLAFLFVAEQQATAQSTESRVRVSVKHVLNASGNRSAGGFFTTDEQIIAAIATANTVLANNGFSWRLLLADIQDIGGISSYFDLSGDAEMRALEVAARASPTAYGWSSNAINIYVCNTIAGAGGICSFPQTDEIIAINNVGGILGGGIGWLHEIGHYLSLTHTFESCHLAGESPPIGIPTAGGPGGGGSNCTGAGASHDGTCDGVVTCTDVCPDTVNVMSYNSFSVANADLTTCQRGHMDFELFNVGGSRGHVLTAVCVFNVATGDTTTFQDARSSAQTRALLYRVRDRVLNPTTLGARWVSLYYKHGGEMADVVRENPRLRRRFAALLAVLSPGLEALADDDERAETLTVPAPAVALLDAVLTDLEQARPESDLARTLREERARLDLAHLAGRSYASVWRRVLDEATDAAVEERSAAELQEQ